MSLRWSHSVEKGKLKKGPWTFEEDIRLLRYIRIHGDGRWSALAKAAGLQRCGKSCRLRWVNYLRPGIKRGNITPEEEHQIMELHARWGNRWSLIAEKIPGRTDNEIKNYWRSHLKKKLQNPNQGSPCQPSKGNDSGANNHVALTHKFSEGSNTLPLQDQDTVVSHLQMRNELSFVECGPVEFNATPDVDPLLAPMIYPFSSEILIPNGSGGFEAASTSQSELYPSPLPEASESDSGLEFVPDIMLWNMYPIPAMEVESSFGYTRPVHVNTTPLQDANIWNTINMSNLEHQWIQ